MTRERCGWVNPSDPLMVDYHDREWGRPVHDDRVLFEFLLLEGAQAGLSWQTILRKRENYREAYAQFDPVQIARFDAKKQQALLQNEGIVRNRLKVAASVDNARAFLDVQREHGSFDAFIWSFVEGKPVRTVWRTHQQIPPRTERSDAMSAALRKRGFRFVGTTICYAFMQACGLAIDHTEGCFLANSR